MTELFLFERCMSGIKALSRPAHSRSYFLHHSFQIRGLLSSFKVGVESESRQESLFLYVGRSVRVSIHPCEGCGAGANPVGQPIFASVADKCADLVNRTMRVRILSLAPISHILRSVAHGSAGGLISLFGR